MPLPRIARLAVVAATLVVAALGCSTDTKRDQFYGTDVGVGWVPPDATPRETVVRDAGTDDAGDAGDAGLDAAANAPDAGADAAPSADAPASDTL
jgi:hypothetical protein